jgi:uncharacterized lipoprotein YehR (DUF1307 family)
MKKQLIISVVVVLLLTVGLSGCNDTSLSIKNCSIEISAYGRLNNLSFSCRFDGEYRSDAVRSICDFIWDFGDGNIAYENSTNRIKHSYNQSGYYTVNVTVKDIHGNYLFATDEISVAHPDDITIIELNQYLWGYGIKEIKTPYVVVVGVIKNMGEYNIINIRGVINFYDVSDNLISSIKLTGSDFRSSVWPVKPGDTTGLRVEAHHINYYDSYTIEITDFDITKKERYTGIDVSILSSPYSSREVLFKNVGERPTTINPYVIYRKYGSDKIDVRKIGEGQKLWSGQSAYYSLGIDHRITEYEVKWA